MIKTGPGPIYRHRTRSTIRQYIINVERKSFLAKDEELFWVPVSGPNGAEPGRTVRQGITRAVADGYGR
jgi:hypothetical protein